MVQKNITSITFFPDGSIYDEGSFLSEDIAVAADDVLRQVITFDSIKRTTSISSPIGELEVIWSGSDKFAASTILKDKKVINTAIFLSGIDKLEESELAKTYIDTWQSSKVVNDLTEKKLPFSECLTVNSRPLCVSVNWANIAKDLYEKISYYEIFLGYFYFSKLKIL